MRKIIALTIALTISSFVFSQTNNNKELKKALKNNNTEHYSSCPKSVNNSKTKSLLPADFPKFIDTGNAKLDDNNFHKAKQKWIKENPIRFQEIKHLNLNLKNKNSKIINDEK